ncbi:MAG TPA: maleylacetoacetate isomerase [Polyangiales bacterium]
MKPILYQFWRSSSSWRIRWALMWKGIDFETVAVDLGAGEQLQASHLERNPLGRVPALWLPERRACLAESVAILEYLEETTPEPRLYPGDVWLRARTRQLVEYVNSGIQPMQCPACVTRAREKPEERTEWSRYFNERGLLAFEKMLEVIAHETGGGRFCVGDEFTAADILLVTQVWSARRFNADLSAMPRVNAAFDAAMLMPHAQRARPENQPDAPKS